MSEVAIHYPRLQVRTGIHKFVGVRKSASDVVDKVRGRRLYSHQRRAAARRDDAPAKLLTDNGDQPPICSRGRWLRRLSGMFGEKGSFAIPGCLTGESEERETWTAESLRAASSGGSIPGSIQAQLRPDETSAVHVSGQHHFREAEGVGATQVGSMSRRARMRWDLVKRCDQPEQVLIQT